VLCTYKLNFLTI